MIRIASVLCLALVCACGGSQKPVEKPKVAAPKVDDKPHLKKFAAGVEAANAGEWTKAAALFKEAAELKPAFTEARINEGVAWERAGKPEQAADVYRGLLEGEDAKPKAAAALSRVLVNMDKRGEADKVVSAALKKSPEDPDLLLAHASLLRFQKKYKQAEAAVRKVLLRDHENVAAFKELGRINEAAGNIELAMSFYRKTLAKTPKDASLYVRLGSIWVERGDLTRAITQFEKALKYDPQNPVANANIGAVALKNRDYARAVKHYENALKGGLDDCQQQSALAYAYEGLKKGPEAAKQMRTAYQQCKDPEMLLSLGLVCMTQTRNNKCALESFESYKQAKGELPEEHKVHMLVESVKQLLAAENAAPVAAPPPEEMQPAAPTEGESVEEKPSSASDAAAQSGPQEPQTAQKDAQEVNTAQTGDMS